MDDEPSIDWRAYITDESTWSEDEPTVRGTGLPVDQVLRMLGDGKPVEQVLAAYPSLSMEAMRAVFALAAESVHLKYPPKVSDDFFEGPEWTVVER
jgi:uncharacterized protein (DUF433 family)